MNAQTVFDCDDLRKEIFSYCLPQYPVITKEMVDEKHMEWIELHQIREEYWFELGDSFPYWKADWISTLETLNRNVRILDNPSMPTIAELYPLWSPSQAKLLFG